MYAVSKASDINTYYGFMVIRALVTKPVGVIAFD